MSPWCPKIHPQNAVLRLTLKSSLYVDYCWLRNRWRKRGPGTQKSSTIPVLRLTLTSSAQIKYSWQTNRWLKLSPCRTKNHSRNPVLRLTLKSSIYTRYYCLRNRWRKQSPWDPSSTSDADIFCANRLLLTDKPLTKNESLVSQNSSSQRSSTADAEIFNVDRLLLAQKPLTKTRSLGPKNRPRSPVLRLTMTSSAQINYSW
jgi:hypothetical protein